jgi:hypothetical protein
VQEEGVASVEIGDEYATAEARKLIEDDRELSARLG